MKVPLKFTPRSGGGFLPKPLNLLCRIIVPVLLASGTMAFAQSVKIGLLVQDSSHISAVNGAELALRLANDKGGLNGNPFNMAVRSMEGPWGTGSKQAVDLIFNEEVWALLGSHEGRNAHLVEQAATRSTVVFVSAWSSDPTLAQAFVPWVFNCLPNDNQQAAALTEEIFYKKEYKKIAVVCDDEYDSQSIHTAFLREIKKKGYEIPAILFYEDFKNDPAKLLLITKKMKVDCLVLFCNPVNSHELFSEIKADKMDPQIYGSISLLNEDQLTINELTIYDNSLIIPCSEWQGSATSDFVRKYQEIFGTYPGMIAAYSFDGMNLLLNAIIKAGSPDREKIQAALETIDYNGVTGIIRFDDMGNRAGLTSLTRVVKGIPLSAWK